MAIVLAHWGEHLLQAFQIYALGWPVPEARGLVGYFFPWLIRSETLHYGYALVMLPALDVPSRFHGGRSPMVDNRARDPVLPPHRTLPADRQATTGHNLFGRPVPTSIVQLWVPRVELHLFYNTIVFIPMVVAMYYHMFPPTGDAEVSVHLRVAPWGRGMDVLRGRSSGPFSGGATRAPHCSSSCSSFALLVVADGLFGAAWFPRNLATVLSWVQYRGLLVLALLVAGNFFCTACPFVLVRDPAAGSAPSSGRGGSA